MLHPLQLLDRRGFLKSATLSAAGATLALSSGFAGSARAATRPDRTLVLLHLGGGNDGINTVIPYSDPAYAQLRPTIKIASDEGVPLTQWRGLHPALAPLMPAWSARDMAILLGLGYPSPDFSHFRSGDIW